MTSNLEAQIKQASARNAELLATLTRTDHAAPALQEQTRFISDLETDLKSAKNKLSKLDAQRQSELADHEKYRDSKVNRFFHKATGRREKFDAKAAKEEKEYHDALQAQHEAQSLQDNLQFQLEQAGKAKEELESLKAVHDGAQAELDQLYHSIFGGNNPGFEREDELERRGEHTLQRYHDTRMRHDAEVNTVHMLSQAKGKADEATRAMDQARDYSRMDMLGGGASTDLMERNALSQAAVCVEMARTFALRGRVDNLPPVNIEMGNMMSDVMFDNIFSDMAFHDKIKSAQVEVQRFQAAVKELLAAAKQRQGAVVEELQQAEKDLEQARSELQRERQAVFEKVLAERQ